MEENEKKFRYQSREEYEKELSALIIRQSKARSRKTSELYEELLEEYLRFCSEEENDGE